jgi:hypothetical protein
MDFPTKVKIVGNSPHLCFLVAVSFLTTALASNASSLIDVAFIDTILPTSTVTTKTGFAAGGVAPDDFWNTLNIGNAFPFGTETLRNLQFVDQTVSDVSLTFSTQILASYDFGEGANGANDAMYGQYLYNNENMTLTLSGIPAGAYNFYFYGHGNEDNQIGIFQFTVGNQYIGSKETINGPDWLSWVWQDGVQYVGFTNVSVESGQTVTLTVVPGPSTLAVIGGLQIERATGPFIVTQPTSQTVVPGSPASFSVSVQGSPPFAYQWQLDDADINGATNSSFSLIDAQLGSNYAYSVVVSNAYGSATSSVAGLNVIKPVKGLIDVVFTTLSTTEKRGFAAVGVTSNDFWNTCTVAIGYYAFVPLTLTNIEFADKSASSAELTISSGYYTQNVGAGYNGSLDPMYGVCLLDFAGSIAGTLTNLSEGVYDFYLYGHGGSDSQNSLFQLAVNSHHYPPEANTDAPGWQSPVWQVGVQYVEYTNVVVYPNDEVIFSAGPNASYYSLLSGLQITPANVRLPFFSQISDQLLDVNEQLSFTNSAYSPNRPITFSLGPGTPAGAAISTDGFFSWTPSCEQGSSTNLITVWATDSGSPPASNSMTFTVIVTDCVEMSIGSSVVQAGQSMCLPVSLVSSVNLTNLAFKLAYESGFLTNFNVVLSNLVFTSATATALDSSHLQLNFNVNSGQALRGASVIGSVCLDTLGGKSQFVPLIVTDIVAVSSNNSTASNLFGENGQIVVIGSESLLNFSTGSSSNPTLTLYGNPGVIYDLLSTTNLADSNSWNTVGSVTLSNLFEVIDIGGLTNQVQFYRAVQF